MLIGGLLLTGAASRAKADEWNKKTYITTSQSIEVPGAVLPPGRYVFKLLDSSSDRHIVQVMNDRENHVYCTNLAIPKERMEPADKTILTFYEVPGGGPEPVRSWFYPGDLIGQEFVYPKSRMQQILASMDKGRITVAKNTTRTETDTAVAVPPPAEESQVQRQTEEQAEVATPAPAPTPSPASPVEEPAPAPTPQTDQAPAPTPEPAMPHTSSNTIEIGVLGLMALGIALVFRLTNRVGSGS